MPRLKIPYSGLQSVGLAFLFVALQMRLNENPNLVLVYSMHNIGLAMLIVFSPRDKKGAADD